MWGVYRRYLQKSWSEYFPRAIVYSCENYWVNIPWQNNEVTQCCSVDFDTLFRMRGIQTYIPVAVIPVKNPGYSNGLGYLHVSNMVPCSVKRRL